VSISISTKEMDMAISRKTVLVALAGAALLAGCATGPYYDDYGYGYGSPYGYGYGDPYYGSGYYYGPSVGLGLGLTYSDRDYRRRGDHRHRDWRRDGRDRDGRDGWRDRGPGDRYYGNPGTVDAERDPNYSPG
jgi:hypothetical protein